ncbi:MAG: arylsulfatase [Planctomycetaceae bacterium]|nr:arylsulfatase [Planctomycetaceae bacterium]
MNRLFASLLFLCFSTVALADHPNIIFVLCDDLGYGDVACLNPECKIKTPHMDRVAAEGMMFTDAHSGSAVCTPTRYGVLTGRYAWRSKLQRSVLGGLSPRLIEQGRMTVASFLKSEGYHTACIGKWHLGMDWHVNDGKTVNELSIESAEQVWNVDYSQPIKNGPNSVGFDYYFGISASLDMVPYTFIEDDHVTVLPTEDKSFAMMLGRTPGTTRKGPTAPGFDANQVLPTSTEKAVAYVKSRAQAAKKGAPFFLYLPYASPHTPILPTGEWVDASGLNPYADFVMQTDDGIGQVLAALDETGLADNTLIIVTSDNGCSPQAKFEELAAKGHHPSYHFRGNKADIYDGGHRVPYLIRWPGKVQAGSTSDQTICLTDLMATCADIVGRELPDSAGEDSVSLLPAFLGKAKAPLREAVVHHSIDGSFAIRQGEWKLELCPGSGGWSAPRPNVDTSSGPAVQLYNLANDIGEQDNVQGEHPEVVQKLTQLMEKYAAQGRSTPGEAQANATEVNVHAAGEQAHAPKKKKGK